MSTTTPSQVRESIVSRIVAKVATAQSDVRFREHREELPIRDWAEQHPTAALRRFSVAWVGEVRGPAVTNTDVELVERDLDVVIAYPTSWRFGGKQLAALEDAIAEDARAVAHVVGTNGFGALAQTTQSASVRTLSETTEIGPAVSYGLVRLVATYWRSNL